MSSAPLGEGAEEDLRQVGARTAAPVLDVQAFALAISEKKTALVNGSLEGILEVFGLCKFCNMLLL